MVTPPQKRKLRKQAQTIKPLIQIGKNGVTDNTINNIDTKLEDHELVKIKYNINKDQREALTQRIAQETKSEIIDTIGNTATLYRRSSNPAKRVIKL